MPADRASPLQRTEHACPTVGLLPMMALRVLRRGKFAAQVGGLRSATLRPEARRSVIVTMTSMAPLPRRAALVFSGAVLCASRPDSAAQTPAPLQQPVVLRADAHSPNADADAARMDEAKIGAGAGAGADADADGEGALAHTSLAQRSLGALRRQLIALRTWALDLLRVAELLVLFSPVALTYPLVHLALRLPWPCSLARWGCGGVVAVCSPFF